MAKKFYDDEKNKYLLGKKVLTIEDRIELSADTSFCIDLKCEKCGEFHAIAIQNPRSGITLFRCPRPKCFYAYQIIKVIDRRKSKPGDVHWKENKDGKIITRFYEITKRYKKMYLYKVIHIGKKDDIMIVR